MGVRAKFRVNKITKVDWNSVVTVVNMTAVSDDSIEENKRYHKYTPSGSLEICIDNPPASDYFKLGKSYYLDFTEEEDGSSK